MVKDRLILLYKLAQVDKELSELYSLRGDLPSRISELESETQDFITQRDELSTELSEIIRAEKEKLSENSYLIEKIEKKDEILRTGKVKTNKEYDAIALEIQDAKAKIEENEKFIEKEYSARKKTLQDEISLIEKKLEELKSELEEKTEELKEVSKQTEEEEKELKSRRDELLSEINPEDLELYERINTVKFGEAIAIVRKGSCLGCYNSIPPQKTIEIKMAEKFYSCESCGRILIAEELIRENNI